jgi:eukaryotic-like serine/threonine-protein kinase
MVNVGATQKLLRFGVFELNLDAEELRKDGIPIKLPPQPVKILALLASRAGQTVTRDEIQKEIWGEETYVDFEHGLNQCIKQIRTALNDNADKPLYVETLPRRGYRFLAPVVSKTIAVPGPRVTESASGIQSRVSLPAVGAAPAESAGKRPEASGAEPERASDVAGPAVTPGATESADKDDAAPGNARFSAPKRDRRLYRKMAWAAVGFAVVVAAGVYWRTRQASTLSDVDTIVIADFENSTGLSVFDNALRQALTADLEESPFLNVLASEKVREQLRFMGQPANAPLKEDVTRQICQRSGSKAMVMGSISSLGSHYPMALRAENCNNGDLLAIVQGEAENREQVVKVLNKMASGMRGKLGESLASVEKYDAPISQVSTPSLEALQAYSLGVSTQQTEGEEAAIPFYRRAIELDPDFAMAYQRLAVIYGDLYQPTLANANLTKAFEFRDHTTERENLSITGMYYLLAVGDLQKTIETYKVYSQIYPREGKGHANLSVVYSLVGNYPEAIREATEAVRLDPSSANHYANCAALYLYVGKFDQARTVLRQAQERKFSNEFMAQIRYLLGFLTGNEAEMKREVADAAGKPGVEDQLLVMQAGTEAFYGKLAKAADYSARATESALKADAKETAATWKFYGALQAAEAGMLNPALREATAALQIAPGRTTQILGALSLARSGDARRAQVLADELAKQNPADTMIQYYWLPTIRAAIALNDHEPAKAIEDLQAALPYDLGSPNPGIGLLYPVYLRGVAYLQSNQPDKAAVEFQKILDHKDIVQNYITGALAQLQLGRAQAEQGDKAAARKSYEDFLAKWKDADSDVPVLIEARSEYAKLN